MRRLLPYFQLCRIPAVFSAIADICCGFVLAHPQPPWLEPYPTWGSLVLASIGLYLAGMVFNDVFDRHVDAIERPHRPLPSGRVTVNSAIWLGGVLLVLGNLAAVNASVASGLVALVLTACVVAYDGFLKDTILGPLVMGACRFFNILLGASTVGNFPEVFAWPQVAIAGGMGIYIVGVTLFSRQEAQISKRWKLTVAMLVINLGLAILMLFLLLDHGDTGAKTAAVALGAIIYIIDRRVVASILNPTPARVQATVKTMLMSLVSLNAIIVFHVTGSVPLTIGIAAMLLPAMFLGKFMTIT
ncbi:MAG: prenyltransferase [Planctomycetaceae bacterium]|nr:prenyltransferase [Planctomycetaceae bacterium]